MEAHHYARLFPMDPDRVEAMTEDMLSNGWLPGSKIVTYEGLILDGRHRQQAISLARVDGAAAEPEYEEYTGHDPLGFVLAANLGRRHLTLKLKKGVFFKFRGVHPALPQGRPELNAQNYAFTQEALAKLFGVSRKTIQNWDYELEHGPQEKAEETPADKIRKAVELIYKLGVKGQLGPYDLGDPRLRHKIEAWLRVPAKAVAAE